MKIKITINSEERAVVIPVDYDTVSDELHINEIQMDPIPDKAEDVSKDVVLLITKLIMNAFKQVK